MAGPDQEAVKRRAGRAGAASVRGDRGQFLNELSELRRVVVELGDRVAADALTHALVCFVKGKDQAGEVWLRMTLEQLR